jgi:hypothetical protein
MTLAGIDPAFYDDAAAWEANPAHRWCYDKLLVAATTGLPAAPLGVDPPANAFPLVVKPITNIFGMGRGAKLVTAPPLIYEPGKMWCSYTTGRHVSVDLRLDPHFGRAVWQATSVGQPDPERFGRFSLWELLGADRLPETTIAERWALANLRHYRGPVNIELIGGRIIEVHLRLTQDWLEAGVYGPHDTTPPPRATLIPEWSDDESEGDHGRIGYAVHRLDAEAVA